ncbi:chemokine-like factor isoform X2 [Bubalus kerabau]|uniref:chemokine-like factor isoform X2 n=1 Tax=Bubalus carabanensis TaxID=3119969 RepID=UPI00244EA616|nr:chemokine-like factor isoform X2 [Bubalus carabanensis]
MDSSPLSHQRSTPSVFHSNILSLNLTALAVTSMTLFILAQAPEPYIVVTGFEVASTFFFILLYILRLDRLISCLFWPLLDIINSVVAAVFMIVVSVLALIPETTTYTVLGGVFGLAASVFCIADGALIYRKLLFNPGGPYQKTDAHGKL